MRFKDDGIWSESESVSEEGSDVLVVVLLAAAETAFPLVVVFVCVDSRNWISGKSMRLEPLNRIPIWE